MYKPAECMGFFSYQVKEWTIGNNYNVCTSCNSRHAIPYILISNSVKIEKIIPKTKQFSISTEPGEIISDHESHVSQCQP